MREATSCEAQPVDSRNAGLCDSSMGSRNWANEARRYVALLCYGEPEIWPQVSWPERHSCLNLTRLPSPNAFMRRSFVLGEEEHRSSDLRAFGPHSVLSKGTSGRLGTRQGPDLPVTASHECIDRYASL